MKEEKRYSVGDIIWHSRYGMNPTVKTCPICDGKKEVTLILGNGDKVILECAYCQRGYNNPTGTVTVYEYIAVAEQRTITAINSVISAIGEEREYKCGYDTLGNDDIFDTEEEALARSRCKAEEASRNQETKIEYLKKDKYRSFSWNAGYWLRQIHEAEKNIERWKEKAKICEVRSKGTKVNSEMRERNERKE